MSKTEITMEDWRLHVRSKSEEPTCMTSAGFMWRSALEPIFLIVQKLNQICFGKMPKRLTSLARYQDFASVRLKP